MFYSVTHSYEHKRRVCRCQIANRFKREIFWTHGDNWQQLLLFFCFAVPMHWCMREGDLIVYMRGTEDDPSRPAGRESRGCGSRWGNQPPATGSESFTTEPNELGAAWVNSTLLFFLLPHVIFAHRTLLLKVHRQVGVRVRACVRRRGQDTARWPPVISVQ